METDLIGYLAGVLTISSFVPQAVKSWRTRSVGDLSPATGILILAGALTWIAYGVSLESIPVIYTNAIVFLIIASIVLVNFFPKK